MAASRSCILPGCAILQSTDPAGDGSIQKPPAPIPERVLTFGATYGHVYDVGYKTFTQGAGTNADIDLSAIAGVDGTNVVGLSGKTIYLEVVLTDGLDCLLKRGTANHIAWVNGGTDSVVCIGRSILLDHLENGSRTSFEAQLPAFDATHKTVNVATTGGCAGYFLVAVK